MTKEPLLPEWNDEHSVALGKANLYVRHRLLESGLFDDENLIRIMDEHPAESLTVSTMGSDRLNYQWQECKRNGATGEELLEVVKRGHLWINIMRLMDFQPEMASLINDAYDELETRCDGFQATHRTANLLLSSPSAIVYYHVDAPLNILWHLRGEKRCWVYPTEPPYVTASCLEDLHAGQRSEDMQYTPEFDEGAAVYDLVPGDMVTWAQNSPHRVENTSGLNVSISTEHLNVEARRQINVHLANRFLRHRFGKQDCSTSIEGPVAQAKVAAMRCARVINRLWIGEQKKFAYPIAFEVDPFSPDGIKPIDNSYDATANYAEELTREMEDELGRANDNEQAVSEDSVVS